MKGLSVIGETGVGFFEEMPYADWPPGQGPVSCEPVPVFGHSTEGVRTHWRR